MTVSDYANIKGDVGGLNSSGQDLATAAGELADVTTMLNRRVKELIHDAGWSGGAADAFRRDWLVSADAGTSLIDAMSRISTAMEHLATVLTSAQQSLDDAKDYARTHKVILDSDGCVVHPSPDAGPGAIEGYQARADWAVHRAHQARTDAAVAFANIVSQLAPGGSDNGLSSSDVLTLADAARSLYGLPAARVAASRKKLEKLDDERIEMKRLHRHMPKQSEEWKRFNEERLANRRLLRGARDKVAELERTESKFKFSGSTEWGFSKLREKMGFDGEVKDFDAMPVVGTVVAGVGIYLGTKAGVRQLGGLPGHQG